MKEFIGPLSGRVYFVARKGLRWEVRFSYRDGSADPGSGATSWAASSVLYWRNINAERAATDLMIAFIMGECLEVSRRTGV